MKEKVYAVLMIDTTKTPAVVQGVGIFGEPNPTTMSRIAQVTLFEMEAATFAEAVELAGNHLAADYYGWCGALKRDTHRGYYRDARGVVP